jgi:glycosyltransferase involved in cell wall biosynthesis
MLGISVAIITYNEERALAECIRSCEDLADEIVVLDSFSTDGTEAIARSFPKVRFVQHAFDGHVEQKSRALAYCKNPWVLALDADERLTPALREEIRALEPGDRVGFRMPRLTYALGRPVRHSGWYPQRKYRLFHRDHARWAGDNPHDFVVVDGKGGDLAGDLLHYSFRDLADQATRANAFSSIQAFDRFRRGRRFHVLSAVVRPVVKFLEVYAWKRGFLDGFAGFVVAVNAAYATFLKFSKGYELEAGLIERPSNVRPDYRARAPLELAHPAPGERDPAPATATRRR